MERLWELTKDYDPASIWNMDERDCFFKALPEKGLAEKKSQARGGKKSKTRQAIAFFVSVALEKVIEPIVIWRSAKPRNVSGTWSNLNILMTCITIQVKNHGWQMKLWILRWPKSIERW